MSKKAGGGGGNGNFDRTFREQSEKSLFSAFFSVLSSYYADDVAKKVTFKSWPQSQVAVMLLLNGSFNSFYKLVREESKALL